MATAKRDLDSYLSKPKPKITYEQDFEPEREAIDVEGYLRNKKGVSQEQREVMPMPTPIPLANHPTEPIKQGGEFVPPPVKSPLAQKTQAEMPQTGQGFNAWERAMIGATPLLVGFLSGATDIGAEAGGNALIASETDLNKREMDFNTKLNEMKAKRAMASTDPKGMLNAKTFEYVGNDGKPRLGRMINGGYYRDETTDPIVPNKNVKEQWITKKINTPNGPREVAYNPVTQETREIGEAYSDDKRQIVDVDFQGEPTKAVANLNSGKLEAYLGKAAAKPASAAESGKDERQIRQIRAGLIKEVTKDTSTWSKRREALEGMARAARLLNDGGPIGGSGIRLILARSVFGEKGPLSDGDVSRMSGDPSGQAVVSRLYDKYLDGELNENDRQDLRTVIDIAARLAKEDATRYLDGYVNTWKAEGYDVGPQLQNFRELPSLPDFKDKQRAKGATQAQSKPKTVQQNGVTYTLNEKTGKYE